MPLPDASMSWWMTMSAVGVVALVAFLVSWLLTDLLHSPRAVYLAALMVVSGSLTYGYLAWSGTDAAAFITNNWGWGLVGALVSGGLTARAIKAGANRRGLGVPADRRGARLAGALVWEGLLYGAAERLSHSPWNLGGGPMGDQAASSLAGATAGTVASSAARSAGRCR